MSDPIILDAAVFQEICEVTCPRCKAGFTPAQRDLTKEFVHAQGPGGRMEFALCLASGFRNSRFAEVKGG